MNWEAFAYTAIGVILGGGIILNVALIVLHVRAERAFERDMAARRKVS